MIFIYNIIVLLLMPLFALGLPIYLLVRPEKRTMLLRRLGFGLNVPARRKERTLWIHALSVGEITSASLLVKQLHRAKVDSTTIVFSTTTLGGHQLAERTIAPYCDALIYYPFDLLPVVKLFQRRIQPDLYIQIETDFWPNLLASLSGSGTTLLLFNGRISDRSLHRYRRFSFFFRPLFDAFTRLCMQTESDVDKMVRLGIAREKVTKLGNLKFGSEESEDMASSTPPSLFPADKLCIFGGSTHAGEESIILDAFVRLRQTMASGLHLVLAPRNVTRSSEISDLAEARGLSWSYFSTGEPPGKDVTIIDTIGDLPSLYRFAALSFIGGSLVAEGGHNPLEPARSGSPVLFGPHMDDFAEISQQLQTCGGALLVKNGSELYDRFALLLGDEKLRREMGDKALRFSSGQAHVIGDHLALIDRYL